MPEMSIKTGASYHRRLSDTVTDSGLFQKNAFFSTKIAKVTKKSKTDAGPDPVPALIRHPDGILLRLPHYGLVFGRRDVLSGRLIVGEGLNGFAGVVLLFCSASFYPVLAFMRSWRTWVTEIIISHHPRRIRPQLLAKIRPS